MTQTTLNTSNHPSLILKSLLANGIFSSVSGLAMMLFSGPIGEFIGLNPSEVLTALGLILVLFGGGILWLPTRPVISRRLAILVTIMDLAWVVGSIILLLSGVISLTAEGKWTIVIVADIVAIFAILQIVGIRKIH